MRSDDRGILSMPVKIAISMAVICAMAPMVLSLADTAEHGMETVPAESEAEVLKEAIGEAWRGGYGAVVTVELSLQPGMSIEAGTDDGDGHVLRVLKDGELRSRIYLDRPSVKVLGPVTISGDRTVSVECTVIDGEPGVRISA